MTTIHESNGWQFKNSPDGVLYRHVNWEGTYWVTSTSLHAYTELCPLPPDPPTLEHEGKTWTREESGHWSAEPPTPATAKYMSLDTLLDRIAKQGDYAEDTE